jgi:hypothetical protein
MDTDKIVAVLNMLDVNDDENWTSTGKPRVEAVQAAMAAEDPLFDGVVTRKVLEEAAPDFYRNVGEADEGEADDEGEGDAVDDEGDAGEVDDEGEVSEGDDTLGEAEAEDAENTFTAELYDALEDPDSTDDERRMAYQMKLTELSARRNALEVDKDTILRAIDATNKEFSEVNDMMKEDVGPVPFAVQHKAMVRAGIAAKMAAHGLMREVSGSVKSPLDAAMVRPTGRKRPTWTA